MGQYLAVYFPVFLDLNGRRCLVVGGGPVAARKASSLVECGATVTVIAPEICAEVHAISPLTLLRRAYRQGEAGQYRFVITATGVAEVDAQVALDAERSGVWVNSADDIDNCTAILPSIHRDGPVTIAVSTGGTSPALATWLRRQIQGAVGTDLDQAATLLSEARQRVKADGGSTETVDWMSALDGPFFDLIRSGHIDAARQLLDEAVRASAEVRP
jgi:siroheme synthase-like protein